MEINDQIHEELKLIVKKMTKSELMMHIKYQEEIAKIATKLGVETIKVFAFMYIFCKYELDKSSKIKN